MIRIYPEQLGVQLNEGLRTRYLFTGNDPLLLQESQDAVRSAAQPQGFTEYFSTEIDAHTDWQSIFSTCQTMSLFASRKILSLAFTENGPTAAMAEQLITLSTLLHNDILLLLRLPKLTKAQENSAWFKALSQNAALVPCQTPEHALLPRWVANRAKSMKLVLDDAAIQLLCYCYEGNLLALSQAIERLSLMWPDGKLTLPRVEQAVNDAAHFTPFHWVDAMLAGKSKRAQHILRQLQSEGCEPVILMRTLQRELMLLLTLQRQMHATPLRTLFDQHRVWQNRRSLFSEVLQRLSAKQLAQSVHLLANTELSLKQDYGHNVWPELATLSLLLCSSSFPEDFCHV
ncbi:DNA polymerase III subunit delta [Erwinia psidii]|uniref:DNA polymerase III subunit delta n=1 Tax=Erwinia psidii TaxID=69224 RepID=A0A3N6UXE0_9GAMM|nr:DNA polymerase III subunit delta [Erwinia psidii]MCX8957120.1 DNA polymerase III subunit delta [Erwinia psidii]MCX8961772.1 DNA polymerase III subunit delta [Erwinia psidii]MCX8965366.1 DNA polymerase III subunit delta [Erwinia psidii]RQM37505.1 DNA polymerase III subunit delta [Erwinia psidii]